jgi:hypothetical protein
VKGRDQLGDLNVNGSIIVRLVLFGPRSSDSRYGSVLGPCEYGNEPSGFIKYEVFIEQLHEVHKKRKHTKGTINKTDIR